MKPPYRLSHFLLFLVGFLIISVGLFLTRLVAASGNQYYVATTGNDANSGTQASPWATIQKAANTMVSGDTVTVLAGNYPQEITIAASKSHLTFLASGSVVTKAWTVLGDYNTVNGFEITDTISQYGVMAGQYNTSYGTGNLIENNNIHNTGQDGIWFFGTNNIFRGNYIHDIHPQNDGSHVDCFQTWGPAAGDLI